MTPRAITIRPAEPRDAQPIAAMSRDFIESGLGWKYDAARVLRAMRDRETLAVVACEGTKSSGAKGAIVRREGPSSSLITDWRRQHRQGLLMAAVGRSDGGRGGPSLNEVAKLRAENERLRKKLAVSRSRIRRSQLADVAAPDPAGNRSRSQKVAAAPAPQAVRR